LRFGDGDDTIAQVHPFIPRDFEGAIVRMIYLVVTNNYLFQRYFGYQVSGWIFSSKPLFLGELVRLGGGG